MEPTGWMDAFTGTRINREVMTNLHQAAHRLYEANTHVFEDEYEALAALGATPYVEWNRVRPLPIRLPHPEGY